MRGAMRFPYRLSLSLVQAFLRNRRRFGKFPLVLMLEPTLRCNLSCAGCDRIRLFRERRPEDMTVDACVEAASESGAPVVTVTGGEPLLYDGLPDLLARLLEMKRHVFLCTNGLLAPSFLKRFKPHPSLTMSVHVDGTEVTHDTLAGMAGTFSKAMETIGEARRRGFRVWTNTSVYRRTSVEELEQLFSSLSAMGVDGMLIAPAFSYGSVGEDIFLAREDIREKFRDLAHLFGRYPFSSTPLYLDFLTGKLELSCTPWGNPTRNPFGWKSPCYLITDTYHDSYPLLMKETPWERYGPGKDPRCANCMVHSGFEPTVMRTIFSNPANLLRLALWNFRLC